MSYKVEPDGELNQGDILREIPIYTSNSGADEAPEPSTVFVLTNGCEIDKPACSNILVARVFRLSGLQQGGLAGNVRAGRCWNAHYLPAQDPIEEDAYIEWRTVTAVPKSTALEARRNGRYLCSITDDQFHAACGSLWDYLFRPRPAPDV